MTISNMARMNFAYNQLTVNSTQGLKSLQKLSSGYRINSAADDAAGLAVSEGMRGQIGGLSQAYQNTMNGIALVQTAEGNLDTSSSILVRMKELAVQSSNATYTDEDRATINTEFQKLKSELDRVSSSTNYNGIRLLDGSLGGKQGTAGLKNMGVSDISVGGTKGVTGDAKFTIAKNDGGGFDITAQIGGEVVTNTIADLTATDTTFALKDGTQLKMDFSGSAANLKEGTIANVGVRSGLGFADTFRAMSADKSAKLVFQVGANGTADQQISLGVNDMSSFALGLSDVDILSRDNANDALKAIESAVSATVSQRSNLGATQNRLEHTLDNLSNTHLNLSQAESTIRDVDMAKEIMKFSQYNIMMQASQAMMAQGMNLTQQSMLGLLMR
ncbi:flagellin [Ruminococcaceae bacterium OttesenSCG-928-L11]|nr:flagellin [Ruminococcaceae bacterium OttesenSCG-928-L11]